ncbi:probable galactinol--sucrose galactosyltransferase 2 [Juglans microcarpa x Juglans regia]|uniref:probable galactinol--sucrose galactosyltransferase 2 n=1 Tax=Juglans microcarpa x Juglans regia TaxID=2249226 RepID=UPI001B7DBD21|nr:probable galactinol--sucrose galactosyltransferase 2 [Juglans microcarpa x Juglans regia]
MTITATPSVEDGCLMVGGRVVLTGVPDNVIVSPVSSGRAAFIGATSSTPSSRHVFSLGVLERGFKFLSLFRVKLWWMIPRVGKSGCEIPMETQMLLLEARQVSVLNNETSSDLNTENTYILFLPVLDGQFRTSLQGTPENELQFCIESGDANVLTSQSLEAVFINSGNNPFELITNSVKTLEKHKCTFSHIENKKIPAHLDWFGWCTWDAFYTEVSPQGIKEGLQNFLEGGCSPKFLIIDDGWQETVNEFQKEGEPIIEGIQFAARLVDIKENSKFKSPGSDDSCIDLHDFIDDIKGKFGLKFVYVWHALAGYWGGVLPLSETLKKYNPKIAYPIQSPGNTGNLGDIVMDILEKYGVGFIDPQNIFEFYNDLHGYLASSGVDGVKVDVQNLIETLGSGYGGRVSLTKRYQEALEQSIARNFKDNNLICSMSLNSDTIYSSKKSAVARASEDFMPREPTLQTLHIASVAFNSLLLGEIVVPDWDMFHSKHDTAEFHAAARAIGGCAVYVSDKPGNHDFKILRKLVLPDGSVLRARYAGRPTRDCLFEDPVMDRKSLLKIWNLNKLSGVIGVFNCQGAVNWPLKEAAQETSSVASTSSSISCQVSPQDVEFLEEIAGERWNGDYAIYAFNSGSLSIMPKKGKFEVSLRTLKCEIYTVSPIRGFGNGLLFTPLGLLDMYNSGGAVEALNCTMDLLGCTIKVKGRGCGRFGAYSSTKPRCCVVDMKEEQFTYNADDGLLTVKLQGECKLREIEFDYRGICV